MIISKDLFIFGEQIFATIIPEIGTPNSTASTVTAQIQETTAAATAAAGLTILTPPTTPTTPIATTVINEEHQIQQQKQPINFSAIQEVALKVAAKTAAASESTLAVAETATATAVEQVCLQKPTSKTGTIKTINKIPTTTKSKTTALPTNTIITTTFINTQNQKKETVASAKTTTTTTTTNQKQLSKDDSTFFFVSNQKNNNKKTTKNQQKIPKDKTLNKEEQKQQQQLQQHKEQKQLEQVTELFTSGNSKQVEIKNFKTKTQPASLSSLNFIVKEQKEQTQKQQQLFSISHFGEEEEEENIETSVGGEEEEVPLVKRNPIKIIDIAKTTTTTTPTIIKPAIKKEELQEEKSCNNSSSKEYLKLLLSTSTEAEQLQLQQNQQQQKQQQLKIAYQPNCNQLRECRLQLEEPLELEQQQQQQQQFLSDTETLEKPCLSSTCCSSPSPSSSLSTSSSSSLTTTPQSSSSIAAIATTTATTKMGKVILGNNTANSGVSHNTTAARNDHAMVTFPFLTDHHRSLQLSFQNITVLHNDRKILSDVSGLVSPGEVLAIMGPSGSGKTTLLDCISGQRRFDSGSIFLNREPISKKWRRKICYVLQEEVFFSGLTLRETVMYTALLRLPEKMPKAEKVKLVDRILQTLELNCCQQTKFGDYLNRGLSGGEKKRANIACELLTNPLLMLLDEPTSGLDSHSAISLMKVLKRYAIQEQKTVVITVHQPSSQMFHMFDKLLLLYNGRTAYFGEVNNIYSYFEDIGVAIKPHYNPADFVLEQLKSYPDIREKLFIAAKESHGNFLNRNCITFNNCKQTNNQQISTSSIQHHTQHHSNQQQNLEQQQQNGVGHLNSDKSQKHDALINDIINNYYKDITINKHHQNHHNNHHNHHLHHHHHHLNHHLHHPDSPMLIIADSSDNHHHHDNCEDAAQQLWCATADSQSNFSTTSSDYHQYESNGDDWLDYPTRFHTQFQVLLSRNFKEAKPMMLSKLNWFQTIGLALMAGAIWFQLPRTEEFLHDLQGWMFFSQTYWMLFALFGALNSFPSEREVISKERRSGAYRLSAYYLAKMFGELPLVITLPTVYLIISYPMLGCASLKLFFLMLVFLLLNTIVAQSVGFFIGACCMDMNVSITLSALYTLATQLFGGYLSSRIPDGLSWIRYTSMIHYAYQNMQILEFREGPAISCGNPSSFEICKNNQTTFIPYDEILKAQNSNSPLWLNTLVLMMFFLVFRILGYAVLRFIRCPKT